MTPERLKEIRERATKPVAYDNGELGMRRLLVDHMAAKSDLADVLAALDAALAPVPVSTEERDCALVREAFRFGAEGIIDNANEDGESDFGTTVENIIAAVNVTHPGVASLEGPLRRLAARFERERDDAYERAAKVCDAYVADVVHAGTGLHNGASPAPFVREAAAQIRALSGSPAAEQATASVPAWTDTLVLRAMEEAAEEARDRAEYLWDFVFQHGNSVRPGDEHWRDEPDLPTILARVKAEP